MMILFIKRQSGYFDAVSITDISPTFFDATLNETNVRTQSAPPPEAEADNSHSSGTRS